MNNKIKCKILTDSISYTLIEKKIAYEDDNRIEKTAPALPKDPKYLSDNQIKVLTFQNNFDQISSNDLIQMFEKLNLNETNNLIDNNNNISIKPLNENITLNSSELISETDILTNEKIKSINEELKIVKKNITKQKQKINKKNFLFLEQKKNDSTIKLNLQKIKKKERVTKKKEYFFGFKFISNISFN